MKNHQCPVCRKSFPSPYKLRRHHATHTGEKPFVCKICGKAFTQSGHLKLHSQKVHLSRLRADPLHDVSLKKYQQPVSDKPAAGMNTRDSSRNTTMPSTGSSVVASQSACERETKSHRACHPFFKAGDRPKNKLHVNAGSVRQNSGSYHVDSGHQDQVVSANESTSVCSGYTCRICLKSFTSLRNLWIHSSVHHQPKQSEKGRASVQTSSTKPSSKVHPSKSKITLKQQCPKCFKAFCSLSKLQRHFLIHTGQKPYSCRICCKTFRQKVHLESHLSRSNKCAHSLVNARKTQNLCNASRTSARPTSHCAPVNSSVELELQCKVSVNAVQDLKKSVILSDAVITPEQSLNTSSQRICHKADEDKPQYLRHKDLKSFQCMICNRAFRLKVNLTRHCKIHRNQKELGSPNVVQISNNGKIPDSEAITHLPECSHEDPVRLNLTVKPETWSEDCTDSSDLLPQRLITSSCKQKRENHQTTSKQQKIGTLHQCHTCLKCFPSPSKLQRHIMTHTGQRPFGCNMCGKRFRQKTHLRVHCCTHLWSRYHKQRSLCIGRPPSRTGALNTRSAADVLKTLVHKKDFETHTCNEELSEVKPLDQTPSVASAQNNDMVHAENKLLPVALKKNQALLFRKLPKVNMTHTVKLLQNPGKLQHKCFKCLKCFPNASKLQRHEMVHTGLKPFNCATCGKAFRQASHLKSHERTHTKRKPSKPVKHQGNMRKLKMNGQQQFNPRITVHIPPQKNYTTHSVCDGAVKKRESGLLCSRSEISTTNVRSLKKNKSNICKIRKLHMCRICCKNFPSPYKLSRHLVIHSGIRPYKCSWCSKTFTQRGHLKTHEHKCREGSDNTRRVMISKQSSPLQDRCVNVSDYKVVNVDAESVPESHSTTVVHCSFSDYSEAIDTEWLAIPEVDLQEENSTSQKKQRESCNQTTGKCRSSFPSDLAFEINKLVHNQNMAAPALSHLYDDNAYNAEIPCRYKGITAISDSSSLLSDEFESSEVENQIQAELPDDYWCEPLTVFECDKCIDSFKSENELKQHICLADVQPEMTKSVQKNHCDICFKKFVSPSKLKRHYVVHTGQRPFRCDICGKTFTQATHVRTHRLTH
ncbi:zinc finger protein 770 [Mastacembelus armatus]|uniref:zinc finger protein 770 n=1 Tax=Mastacembelus armatus TaxID=205130 RepID=UPI000E457A7B|nr:zinc finger protein 770-like [Mastacembelus armatus]